MEGDGSPIQALSHMPRPERWLSWPSALLTAVSLLVPLEMASQARLDHGGSRDAGDAAPHLRLSVGYLAGACSPRGRFAYIVDAGDGGVSRAYNIVRHAGAVYSLAMYNQFHPDARALDTITRAATFMRTVYMSRDPRSHELVVWSKATGFNLILSGPIKKEPSPPIALIRYLPHLAQA
jgi:hypothetical protein